MKMLKMIIVLGTIILLILSLRYFNIKKEEKTDKKIPVLLYHDFKPEISKEEKNDFNYINTPESFEENIKTLIDNNYTIISLEELNEMIENKEKFQKNKIVVITFDDGYYSNYEYIYPILRKYNVKASIFITTDKIGTIEEDGRKYLSWNECLEMQNSGLVEIYSHSKRHIFYNKYHTKEIIKDVLKSYKEIDEKLGKRDFKPFAYPYGAYTINTVRALKYIGIEMQLYDIGINNLKDFKKDYIKRINIPCDMTGIEIIQEINISK